MNATVVAAWSDALNAHVAITVAEGGALGAVEYIGSVPLAELAGMPAAQQEAALQAAAIAVRAALVGTPAAVTVSLPKAGAVIALPAAVLGQPAQPGQLGQPAL